jgi:hypothetical protein
MPVVGPLRSRLGSPESKCLCLNFEVRDVRSIETPVSKSFRPRGFFVRKPRHAAKKRDVTPVFLRLTFASSTEACLCRRWEQRSQDLQFQRFGCPYWGGSRPPARFVSFGKRSSTQSASASPYLKLAGEKSLIGTIPASEVRSPLFGIHPDRTGSNSPSCGPGGKSHWQTALCQALG